MEKGGAEGTEIRVLGRPLKCASVKALPWRKDSTSSGTTSVLVKFALGLTGRRQTSLMMMMSPRSKVTS